MKVMYYVLLCVFAICTVAVIYQYQYMYDHEVKIINLCKPREAK